MAPPYSGIPELLALEKCLKICDDSQASRIKKELRHLIDDEDINVLNVNDYFSSSGSESTSPVKSEGAADEMPKDLDEGFDEVPKDLYEEEDAVEEENNAKDSGTFKKKQSSNQKPPRDGHIRVDDLLAKFEELKAKRASILAKLLSKQEVPGHEVLKMVQEQKIMCEQVVKKAGLQNEVFKAIVTFYTKAD